MYFDKINATFMSKKFNKTKQLKIFLAMAQPTAGFGKGLQGNKEQKGTF